MFLERRNASSTLPIYGTNEPSPATKNSHPPLAKLPCGLFPPGRNTITSTSAWLPRKNRSAKPAAPASALPSPTGSAIRQCRNQGRNPAALFEKRPLLRLLPVRKYYSSSAQKICQEKIEKRFQPIDFTRLTTQN